MNLDACFDREPGVVARRIAGETILVPVTRRAQEMGLFTLNEVGTFVWEALGADRSLATIATAIEEHFDVDGAQAREDLVAFVGLLAETGCAREVSA